MSHKVEIHLKPAGHSGDHVRVDGREIRCRSIKLTGGVGEATSVELVIPGCDVVLTADDADVLIDHSSLGDEYQRLHRVRQR